MVLKLISNFRDFYDHAFFPQGTPFERLSTGGMNRREQFAYLQELGLQVPRHGIVSSVVPRLLEDWSDDMKATAAEKIVDLVVYTDEQAHAGAGKVRLSLQDALRLHPDAYCCEFMATTQTGVGRSERFLQVGDRKWWLRYWSDSDWRSNCGEGGVEVLGEDLPRGYHSRITAPLFAIDFIRVGHKVLAIDFNTAPGLAPLRDVLSPTEVVELLTSAIERIGTPTQTVTASRMGQI